MAKPIAGINDYPYGICGYVVDGAYLHNGSKVKSYRIYKQRSDVMFDLIDPKTNEVHRKVLITGKDISGELLDYSKSNDELINIIPRNTFFIRGYNEARTKHGFVIRFLLNKVILSTGLPLYDMYTPTCNIPLPEINNIVIAPVHEHDTTLSGSLSSSSGPIDPTDMIVKLVLPDGTEHETTVNADGTFEFTNISTDIPGTATITITSPNYEEATVTFEIIPDGEDSDYVTSISLAEGDFTSSGDEFVATIPASLHLRGSDLVIQLQSSTGNVFVSSVNVSSTGDITITQSQQSPMEVVIIGKTTQTVPYTSTLAWTSEADGTYSASIPKSTHQKSNISFTVYDSGTMCTVDVEIDDSDNLTITSLEQFSATIVITGKE